MLYSLSKPNASIQDCLKGMKPTKRLDGIWVLDQKFICNRIPFNSKCYLILLMWALRYPKACHLLEELYNSFSKMTVKKSPSSLITDPEGIYWVQREGTDIIFSPCKGNLHRRESTKDLTLFPHTDVWFNMYIMNNVSFSELLTQLYLDAYYHI